MPGTETTIKAIDALRCIRRGMTDRELMGKFNLSAAALQSLFSQLTAAGILHASEVQARTKLDPTSVIIGVNHDTPSPFSKKKKVIEAAEALQSIKAGMDDATLMAKFDISPRGLHSLLSKLESTGAISRAELDGRTAPEQVTPKPDDRAMASPMASPVASLSQMGVDPGAILEDIRAGLDDIALMEKFALSGEALQVVFEELLTDGHLMPSDLEDRTFVTYPSVVLNVRPTRTAETPLKKPVIDAADALHCIQDGMEDAALMKRYELSAKGLQSLFTKLVSAGAISQEDLEKRVAKSHSEVVVDQEITEETDLPVPHELLDKSRIIEDIKAGAGHEALMDKYGLSSKDLRDVMKGLVSQGAIDESALDQTLSPGAVRLEIKHKDTRQVMYRGVARSLGGLVEEGVSEQVSLAESDLAGINLSRRDLSGAKFHNANLRKAILVGADLTGADLSGAILASADLYGANLYKANLSGADLSDSNMTGVRAVWAFLANANLSEANLTSADLTGANLGGANLFESILTGTKLDGAYLVDAKMDYVRRGN